MLNYSKGADMIMAAILHDTLEDTSYDTYQMTTMFGKHVTMLVRQVTHLYSKEERLKLGVSKTGNLYLLIVKGDTDAMMIKLMDRLHNMRTLGG